MKGLVVITGASSGIGKELAVSFSREWHPVLLLARRKYLMEELNLENCICKSVDITKENEVKQAILEAEEKYGKTQLLINCAGIMLLGKPDTQNYDEWATMVDTNIKGILTGTSVVLPDMIKQNNGTIINISSIAGRKTFDNHSV